MGHVTGKSRSRVAGRRVAALLATALGLLALVPAAAQAHGPIDPVASDYLARITSVPAGLRAAVVDGDLRLWLSVSAGHRVTVLDSVGAPYLRFGPDGVWVNTNSAMYYTNATPVALTPPPGLTRSTPPSWQLVSRGHTDEWHDGRLHALASVALAPGAAYVGGWRVALVLDGRASAISGSLWHRGAPSIAWFWPVVVLVLCTLAAWRLREPELDRRLARGLAITTLAALTAAAAARGLHGRPGISALGAVEFAAIALLALWALARVLRRPPGFLLLFLVALAGLWEGITLLPTLLDGYGLTALPLLPTRIVDVLCLGASIALLPLAARLAGGDRDEDDIPADDLDALSESLA